jgi:hypothetical protein
MGFLNLQKGCSCMKNHSMSNFEVRSALVFSALILGTAFAAQAGQGASPCKAAATQNAPRTKSALTKSVAKSAATPVTMPATEPSQQRINRAQAAFNRADLNGDGKLSRSETRQFPIMTQRFKRIDTNHDNLLTFEELMRAALGNV